MLIGIFLLVFLGGGVLYYRQNPAWKNKPSDERLKKIQDSPHYIAGKFQSPVPVQTMAGGSSGRALRKFLFESSPRRVPREPLPVMKTDLKNLSLADDLVIWLGHSSFYLQLDGRRILIDPVLSSYAAPFSFLNKAFAASYIYTAEDMPPIDLLVVSHDHWDHLDYPTVTALRKQVKAVVCPLGVGQYFEQWGYSSERVKEADWFSEVSIGNDFSVHVLPTQHFSGRMLKRNQTLWGAFAFVTPERRVFYSGDGGYGPHFKEIGRRFNGFDLAIMENGQYNSDWANIHMMPEESSQAAVDLGARTVLPAHSGKFALSFHDWDEPYKRIVDASQDKPYELLTPEMGAIVRPFGKSQDFSAWWEIESLAGEVVKDIS